MKRLDGLMLYLTFGMPLSACHSSEKGGEGDSSTSTGDPPIPDSNRFEASVLPESLHNGGYIDSTFINKDGDRIYFLHSILSPSVLDGRSSLADCYHAEAEMLPGHTTTPGLEWNTDIYYVEWDGDLWSEPINLGPSINSLGMECCMWLNDDETEIIFNTVSDLDGDGQDEDMGMLPTGNYRATRDDRDGEWSAPVALPGVYGTEGQDPSFYRHDIQKLPSGNLYLWQKTTEGDNLLVFGERTGGTDEEPIYADPVTIEGTTNYETQIWVNDTETRMVFNHRQASGETELYTRERASMNEPWGESSPVSTTDFADSTGSHIWGEPSFDETEDFMLFTRFDTSDSNCWAPDIMVSDGNATSGFGIPTVLN